MKPNIFPFTLYAADIHYVNSPKLATRLWLRDREKVAPKLTWYAVDLEVTGPKTVQLHIREMANSFSGGIGRVVFTHTPELAKQDLAELQLIITEQQLAYAADEFRVREAARFAAEVEAIRRELFEPAEAPQ